MFLVNPIDSSDIQLMVSETSYVENVKKIAILRANAIGDFIVTLPAIEAIRLAYPEAELVLLGKPWHKDFLKGKRTPIDRVIIIPIINGIREEVDQAPDLAEQQIFFTEVIKEQFDIAIHFQGKGISANPFLNKLGAKLTVGLSCPEAESVDRSIDFFYYQCEVMRYLEVASLIGASPVHPEPKILILPEDEMEINPFLNHLNNKPFVILHACGTDYRRMWNIQNFSNLGDLISKNNYQIIFTGTHGDSETITGIIENMEYSAINSSGMFSLGGLAALFTKSELVISIDTGPLHLARAAGARTIGLYWAPNLINWGPITRSRHRPVISWNMECPYCGIIPNDPYPYEPKLHNCTHNFSSIEDITVEKVMEEVNYFLRIEQ